MKFTKMHGSGNDYIYLDCRERLPSNLPELARKLSHRHFGIGGDGLICICSSDQADFRMIMFNADGSEGAMCGNGIRCLGKYVYDKGLTTKNKLTVETRSGLRQLSLQVKNGTVTAATVDMGVPDVGDKAEITVKGKTYTGIAVSMGNPHLVVQWADLAHLDPERDVQCGRDTNIEFVKVRCRGQMDMRVWERGSGETMACGTGACAAVAAMATLGRVKREVTVSLPGGNLEVQWQKNGHMLLTGPAVTVFEGEV